METEATLSKRARFLVLLLILLLHGSLLMFLLFVYQDSNKPPETFDDLFQKQASMQEEWVASYGQSGAPVIFADAPSDGAEQPMAVAQQDTSSPSQQIETITSKQTSEEVQNKKVEVAQEEPQEDRSSLDLLAILDQESEPIPVDKKIIEKSLQQLIAQNKTANADAHAAAAKPRQSSGSTSSQTGQAAQRTLSLAQIAQGFAQHLANEGNDAFSSAGKRDGKATAEQIMYAQYNDKISECLTNSLHIHKDKFYLNATNKAKMALLLEIAKDGSIKNLEVVSGTGIPYVDKFMLFVFRDAATSFPPLPTYFKEDTFKTIRTFSHTIASIKNPSAGYWSPIR